MLKNTSCIGGKLFFFSFEKLKTRASKRKGKERKLT